MSDSVRLYQAVYLVILTHAPELTPEHKVTLSQMVTGILRSGHVQFRKIAQKVNYHGRTNSLVDKFRRFVRNKNISTRTTYLPFISWSFLKEKRYGFFFI